MNGFLIQIKNKTNKIIKLNNEIAHERIPNTNQKLSPPAGRPAFFPFFVVHKVSRMFSPKPPGRPAGPAQTSPDRPRPAQTCPDRPRPAQKPTTTPKTQDRNHSSIHLLSRGPGEGFFEVWPRAGRPRGPGEPF